jgi:hypothetical protein
MRVERWAGPAIAIVGAALVLAAYLRGADRTSVESALLLPILQKYEIGLALVGLGLALVQHRPWQRLQGFALFAIGIIAGAVLEQRVIAAVLWHSYTFFFLFGPSCCLLVGLALLLPQRIRAFFLPAVALIAGIAVGVTIGLDNVAPPGVYGFEIAAGLAAMWVAAAVVLHAPWLDAPWVPVAGKVGGSWLIAIGLLLGAAGLLKPRAAVEAPSIAPPSQTFLPDTSKFPDPEEPGGSPPGGGRSSFGERMPP